MTGAEAAQLVAWEFYSLTTLGRVDQHLWSMRTLPGGVPALTRSMTAVLLDLPGVQVRLDGRLAWEGPPMQLPDLRALAGGQVVEPDPDPDDARDEILATFDDGLGGGL